MPRLKTSSLTKKNSSRQSGKKKKTRSLSISSGAKRKGQLEQSWGRRAKKGKDDKGVTALTVAKRRDLQQQSVGMTCPATCYGTNWNTVRLDNGTRVVYVGKNQFPSTSLIVYVRAGSMFEKIPEEHGISHMIEHALFKGSKRHPEPFEITSALDGFGQFNAYTTKNHTAYYIQTIPDKVDQALHLYSDIMQYPLFEKQNMEDEKQVVFQEIARKNENLVSKLYDLAMQMTFAGTPLAHSIVGSEQTLKPIHSKQLHNYHKRWYVPENIVVAIAGTIPNEVPAMVEKLFGGSGIGGSGGGKKRSSSYSHRISSSTKGKDHNPAPIASDITHVHDLPLKVTPKNEINVMLSNIPIPQIHLLISFLAPGANDIDRFYVELAKTALGGTMSSRLVHSLREQGLIYSMNVDYITYDHDGIVVMYTAIPSGRIEQALSAIIREINDMKKNKLKTDEFNKILSHVKANLGVDLESSMNLAQYAGMQVLLGQRLLDQGDLIALHDKMNPTELRRVTNRVFDWRHMNVVMLGNTQQQQEGFEGGEAGAASIDIGSILKSSSSDQFSSPLQVNTFNLELDSDSSLGEVAAGLYSTSSSRSAYSLGNLVVGGSNTEGGNMGMGAVRSFCSNPFCKIRK